MSDSFREIHRSLVHKLMSESFFTEHLYTSTLATKFNDELAIKTLFGKYPMLFLSESAENLLGNAILDSIAETEPNRLPNLLTPVVSFQVSALWESFIAKSIPPMLETFINISAQRCEHHHSGKITINRISSSSKDFALIAERYRGYGLDETFAESYINGGLVCIKNLQELRTFVNRENFRLMLSNLLRSLGMLPDKVVIDAAIEETFSIFMYAVLSASYPGALRATRALKPYGSAYLNYLLDCRDTFKSDTENNCLELGLKKLSPTQVATLNNLDRLLVYRLIEIRASADPIVVSISVDVDSNVDAIISYLKIWANGIKHKIVIAAAVDISGLLSCLRCVVARLDSPSAGVGNDKLFTANVLSSEKITKQLLETRTDIMELAFKEIKGTGGFSFYSVDGSILEITAEKIKVIIDAIRALEISLTISANEVMSDLKRQALDK